MENNRLDWVVVVVGSKRSKERNQSVVKIFTN
jgi:hypothetical protein